MSSIKPQTLKGFRDFLPEEMKIRNYVLTTCKQVFESFGFEPLETPALEYASTLLGKYGKEADTLVYTFKDRGQREVGLRYDLTVPVARVLAQYNQELGLPFKRYQIQPVWRAENPQKGRFREFIQCDIDIFGVKSVLADAVIVAITFGVLKKIGLDDFVIKINSRQVLFKLLDSFALNDNEQKLSILQSIDKLDKQGQDEVEKELVNKGLTSTQVKKLFSSLKSISPDDNLKQMFSYLENFGVNNFSFAPSMVRGLDYYTGPIFETYLTDANFGSLTGGGRYDNLIKLLGGPDLTGTGTTIGFDRICEVIKDRELLSNKVISQIKILITIISGYESRSIQLSKNLRKQGINSELYLEEKPLDKQLKYANRKKIPYVVILGPNEVKTNKVTLKDMTTGKQILLETKEIAQFIAR